MYKIPQEYYFRLHHCRPRFKGDPESVLLYVAQTYVNIGRQECYAFRDQANNRLLQYADNFGKTIKTMDNWRTEISALFSFVKTDGNYGRITSGAHYWPSRRAAELAEKQDLAEAFKTFLYNFQYPGGHIKAGHLCEQINNGIHFKPAQYILKVLREANRETGRNSFGMTKEEACHCIFNDLRVTRDGRSPMETWKLISGNRDSGVDYDGKGDVIRYAGDILDYLVLANLMKTYDGRMYFLNRLEEETIIKFCESSEWYGGYDAMIKRRSANIDSVRDAAEGWFEYTDRDMSATDLSTDILVYIAEDENELAELKKAAAEMDILEAQNESTESHLSSRYERLSTKEIGDIGENLVLGHECMRMKLGGKEDLIHLIKRMPTQYSVGYDILSVELDARKRFIEVKTTVSSRPLQFNSVHLTPNEWNMADTVNDRYYIYRLAIAKNERKLYLLQDPVGLYKRSKVRMVPANGGVDITFDPSEVGSMEELLTWTS